jgi:hypothetical protein
VEERRGQDEIGAKSRVQLRRLAAERRDADRVLEQPARVGVVIERGRERAECAAGLGVREDAPDGRTQSGVAELGGEEVEEAVELVGIAAERRREGAGIRLRRRELVRGYGWNVFGVIVLTILLLIGFSIVLGLILVPVADWLRDFISNVVSGTLTAPFIALTWTLLYYRLRATKTAGAEQPAGPPAS